MDCQVCHCQPAKWAMYPIDSKDAPRNGGKGNNPVPMCDDCAMDAWEQGTHEADGELDEVENENS